MKTIFLNRDIELRAVTKNSDKEVTIALLGYETVTMENILMNAQKIFEVFDCNEIEVCDGCNDTYLFTITKDNEEDK